MVDICKALWYNGITNKIHLYYCKLRKGEHSMRTNLLSTFEYSNYCEQSFAPFREQPWSTSESLKVYNSKHS